MRFDQVITGFNTDIKFEGVTYHVQTEDKGLDAPLILSLVYVGGAIIASKRTPYEDLVASGYDEKVLTERLQRQHKLICAAIRSGRVEELKRMGGHNGSAESPHAEGNGHAPTEEVKAAGRRKKKNDSPPPVDTQVNAEASGEDTLRVEATGGASNVEIGGGASNTEAGDGEPKVETGGAESNGGSARKTEDGMVILTSLMDQIEDIWDRSNSFAPSYQPPVAQPTPDEAPAVHEQEAPAQPLQEAPPELPQEDTEELYLTLLDDEGDFRAGQLVMIKVHVGRGAYGQRPVTNATVTVKILGTTFRPMIQTTESDARGVAVVRATLPRFTSGRAAIIIRAAVGDDAIEMRRIIHQ